MPDETQRPSYQQRAHCVRFNGRTVEQTARGANRPAATVHACKCTMPVQRDGGLPPLDGRAGLSLFVNGKTPVRSGEMTRSTETVEGAELRVDNEMLHARASDGSRFHFVKEQENRTTTYGIHSAPIAMISTRL